MLVVAIGEFRRWPVIGVSTSGNSNASDGRDHWPYCYSAVVAGCGIARGAQYGESDQTAWSPKDKPTHPNDLLPTVYYTLGTSHASATSRSVFPKRDVWRALLDRDASASHAQIDSLRLCLGVAEART